MVEFGILEQTHRANCWEGVLPDYRLNVVVKINNVGFPEA